MCLTRVHPSVLMCLSPRGSPHIRTEGPDVHCRDLADRRQYARLRGHPAAVVALDAALARWARERHSVPTQTVLPEEWLWSLPAVQVWRWVRGFADARSESPGESWSRVLIHDLGFEPPQLQVEVQLPQGIARVDFEWWGVFGSSTAA